MRLIEFLDNNVMPVTAVIIEDTKKNKHTVGLIVKESNDDTWLRHFNEDILYRQVTGWRHCKKKNYQQCLYS